MKCPHCNKTISAEYMPYEVTIGSTINPSISYNCSVKSLEDIERLRKDMEDTYSFIESYRRISIEQYNRLQDYMATPNYI